MFSPRRFICKGYPMKAFLFTLSLLMVLRPHGLSASQYSCADLPSVSVVATARVDADRICPYARRALTVLEGLGLSPLRPIVIRVTENSLASQGYEAYGTYNSRRDIIELMSYEAVFRYQRHPMMYDELFDPVHYGGAVAHEIAHAVFDHHSLGMSPGTAHQEYLAHAVQLASLPEERRKRILEKYDDIDAWQSGDAISDIYMALEPTRFAVKSYKHLMSLENPNEFVKILLNSKWFYVYIP